MSNKIKELISKNFDTILPKSLGLPNGKIKIKAIFKIDTLGSVINIKVSAPYLNLRKKLLV